MIDKLLHPYAMLGLWVLAIALAFSVFNHDALLPYAHAKWVEENRKECWMLNGKFEISKYGVRCSTTGFMKNIFIKTFEDKYEDWSR